MGVNLKEGVSRINFMSIFILSFVVTLVIYTKTSILAYLLVEDYGISQHDSGKIVGYIGLYSAICVLPGEFLFGTMMDIIGRKIPIVIGMVVGGGGLILMTFFDEVYPTLVLLSIAVSVAILVPNMAPLLLDYVKTESLGAASVWVTLIGLAGSSAATSGIIKLQEYYSIDLIFNSVGCLTILTGGLLLIGLKEMTRKKDENSSNKT